MSNIVKGFRQKQDNNTFTEKINFSSDSKFINTFSGLNLEEELKLGGLNTVGIIEENGVILILETAKSSPLSSGHYNITTAIKEKTNNITFILKLLDSDSSEIAKMTIIQSNGFITTSISEYYIDPGKFNSILTSWGVNL